MMPVLRPPKKSAHARDLCLFRLDRAYDVTPIGRNRGGRVMRLLDEDGLDVPDGVPGELCYENPYVRGYRNLPEKTAEALAGSELTTPVKDLLAR